MDIEMETRRCLNGGCSGMFRISKNHNQKFCSDICRSACDNNYKDGKVYYRVTPEKVGEKEKLQDNDGIIKMGDC